MDENNEHKCQTCGRECNGYQCSVCGADVADDEIEEHSCGSENVYCVCSGCDLRSNECTCSVEEEQVPE